MSETKPAEGPRPYEDDAPAPWVVQWFTWPVVFLAGLAVSLLAITRGWNYGLVFGLFNLTAVAFLVVLEVVFPLRERWRMTKETFFLRDIKYILAAIVATAAIDVGLGLVQITIGSGHKGPITNLPIYLAVPAALLVFEFIQYWYHRLSHETGGHAGEWMWRTHSTHHASDRVYVLMHPVFHPINAMIVRGLATIIPLYFLGITPEAALLVNVIAATQGLVSHFNVSLRAGWFNYIFSGNEIHRFHHSADRDEAKNYGTTLVIWDLVFGTFRYKPAMTPARLGLDDPSAYPDARRFWRTIAFPFHAGAAKQPQDEQDR